MAEGIIDEISIQPEIKKETGQKQCFDISTLAIDEKESRELLKEGRFPAPNMEVAYDEKGHKLLLKAHPIFVAEDGSFMTGEEFIAKNGRDLYENCVRALQGEEAAWRMASFIGVPMAETHFIELGGVPFIAYQFIEGAKDRGFGGEFSFAEPGT